MSRRCFTLLDDEVGDVVDLFFGVEAAEAEADARVRELVADAERAEHVARLEAGAACTPSRARHATSLIAIIIASPSTKANEMLRLPAGGARSSR